MLMPVVTSPLLIQSIAKLSSVDPNSTAEKLLGITQTIGQRDVLRENMTDGCDKIKEFIGGHTKFFRTRARRRPRP